MRWTLRALQCVIAESDHGETRKELQEKLRMIAELKLAPRRQGSSTGREVRRR
jgi:hypothetical protein